MYVRHRTEAYRCEVRSCLFYPDGKRRLAQGNIAAVFHRETVILYTKIEYKINTFMVIIPIFNYILNVALLLEGKRVWNKNEGSGSDDGTMGRWDDFLVIGKWIIQF